MIIKELIGQHVIANVCYGIKKGEEVFGILSYDKGEWIVTVIEEDGNEIPYSVYYQTINQA